MSGSDYDADQDGMAGNDAVAAMMDQSSIDGMLGFATLALDDLDTGNGINQLYDPKSVPQLRNPRLEAVVERMIRSLKNSLRKIASDQVEVILNSITNQRCQNYMESIALPAVLAVVRANPWGGSFLIVLGASLVYSLVEITLGSPTKGVGAAIEGRAFTAIETRIARRLLDAIMADAEEAFSTVSPVTFALDHIENIPRFINIAPPSSIAVTVSVTVQLGDMSADIEIVIPNTTLEPIRGALNQSAGHGDRGNGNLWSSQLLEEVHQAPVKLSAILQEEQFPLGRIMSLAVGETLLFERGPDEPIELRCENVPVAVGRAGRSGNRVAFKLGAILPKAASHA